MGRIKGQLTFRALAVGLAVGTLLCFSNTYFGLQTGWVTMGSLQVSFKNPEELCIVMQGQQGILEYQTWFPSKS